MKNQSKIRKSIIHSFLALSLTVGILMPAVIAQEGGRSRQAPRVTCTTSSYDLIIVTVTITECSDGTTSTSVS